MTKRTCTFFYTGCSRREKNACTEEQTGKCDEGIRRRLLAQKPCPIMIASGYIGSSAQCDDSDLRAQVPDGKPCHINGKCIRELSPAIQKLYGRKKQYTELNEPIKETLSAFQL